MIPYTAQVEYLTAGEFLIGQGANETSQGGEDGLLAACLDQFGATNRWCFEVGAHDGLQFSNTHWLRCDGWHAVLIESDPELFKRLCDRLSGKVACIQETIGPDSLDRILKDCGAPEDIDFGCIDIDGQDWHVWNGMQRFRPRLMLVEFDYGSDDLESFVPTLGGEGQASRKAIEELGREKGYTPLAKTLVNLLFARNDIL